MSVIVRADGFGPDEWPTERVLAFEALAEAGLPNEPIAVTIANDRDPADLAPWLDRLAMIRVAFPAMGDGRGFSIARRLRAMGYAGTLRAAGPLIADQMTAARDVGFDEIEVPDALAARQPARLWTRREASYQRRVFGG